MAGTPPSHERPREFAHPEYRVVIVRSEYEPRLSLEGKAFSHELRGCTCVRRKHHVVFGRVGIDEREHSHLCGISPTGTRPRRGALGVWIPEHLPAQKYEVPLHMGVERKGAPGVVEIGFVARVKPPELPLS